VQAVLFQALLQVVIGTVAAVAQDILVTTAVDHTVIIADHANISATEHVADIVLFGLVQMPVHRHHAVTF
jgi:hypothetical protein